MKPVFLYIVWVLVTAIMLASPAYATGKPSTGKPQRIASLGICTDQLLLMMVDRSRIVTLTHLAADPALSYMAHAVGDIPLNHAAAEEIIPWQPDLVISTPYASPDTVRILRELGYRVELATLPTTLEGTSAMLREVGQWLGEPEKAEQIIADMQTRIAAAQARNAGKPQRRAIIYSPNGYTIGANTLEDDILKQSGYRNLAAEMGISDFRQIPLETLVTTRPDAILIDNHAYNQNSLAYSYITHPVLTDMMQTKNLVYVPSRLRDCAGPMAAEEIEFLADQR